ncbi:endonuclease MutS2 [Thermodesulfobacteriota bacterium]
MIKYTYHVLEFHKLLHILSGYASCPLGQSDCLSLEPSKDLKIIDNEQILVSEMKLLLKLKGFFPFEGLIDVGSYIKSCRAEGSCLEPDKLLFILGIAEAARDAKKTILSQKDICPGLYNMIKEMALCEELRKSVSNAINPNRAIKDSASNSLRRLRRKLTGLRKDLQKRLEDIKRSLNVTSNGDDNLISIRDGRYIIPLRTDMKNRVQGIVHDYSRTQATCYFEPIEAIVDNNRLAELNHLEKEEELRVLSCLTAMVRDRAEDLLGTQAMLGKLDGLYARARFSDALGGVRPVMSRESVVDLRQAKNPILICMAPEGEDTVPLDIFLDKDVNILIISGPNRGGKTVTLKSLGLLSLMAQAGIHIPAAEGSRLPVFRHIIAEIGDDQDIQSGLSTFSAHVSHIKYMIEHADHESLIIIDEPGMGTDPDEGAALAMALLDELAHKSSLVAVSTHYNRLKSYGLLEKRAKNACMGFDDAANRPSFSLHYGTPGTSYAFEVAQNLGINKGLLTHAKGYLDQDEVRLNRLIDKLNSLIQETHLERSEAEHVKRKYHSAKEKVLKTLNQIESNEQEMLDKKRNEADFLIKESTEEFKNLINSLKGNKRPSQAYVKKRHDEITEKLVDNLYSTKGNEKPVEDKGLKIGQFVRHMGLDLEGRIHSLDNLNSKASILTGNVKLSVETNALMVIPDEVRRTADESTGDFSCSFTGDSAKEINLIGYKVEDALPLIDKMIDRSIVEGGLSLKLVHGHGTGKLKTAIRDHLRKFSCVKRIGGADPKSGGEAITIVELN